MTLSLLIETQRRALLRLVVMLVEASGLVAGKPAFLSRIIRGSVLHRLRPAESATRRLVVALAKDLIVRVRAKRPAPSKPIPRGTGERAPVFPLFDRRPRVGVNARAKYAKGVGPRLSFFDGSDPVVEASPAAQAVSPDAPIESERLRRRMEALKAALEDLPKQARRMARLQAKRKLRPMRPGRPPGHRARGRYEIDEILRECHQIALMALAAPDTS